MRSLSRYGAAMCAALVGVGIAHIAHHRSTLVAPTSTHGPLCGADSMPCGAALDGTPAGAGTDPCSRAELPLPRSNDFLEDKALVLLHMFDEMHCAIALQARVMTRTSPREGTGRDLRGF